MKTLQMIFGVSVLVVLLGLNVATADIKNESAPLTFAIDTGDSSVTMPDVSFDTAGSASSEEAQTTCATTPGGPATNLLLEAPIVPPVTPDRPEGYNRSSSQESLAPLNSLASPTPYSPNRRNSNRGGASGGTTNWGEPEDDNPVVVIPTEPPKKDEPTHAVPEPATLVIVGLGIGATAVARRRWKNR